MGPQYTKCVPENDFSDLNYYYLTLLAGVSIVALFAPGAGVIAGLAILEGLRYVLNWLLYGKLICLVRNKPDCECPSLSSHGQTVCAIGEIVDTEAVGEDKNLIEDLDDDYSINLALMPVSMAPYVALGHEKSKPEYMAIATAADQVQGDLHARQISKHGKASEFGYLRDLIWITVEGNYVAYNEVVGRDPSQPIDKYTDWLVDNAWKSPKRFKMPVLHCEFEGSRTRDVLDVIEGFPFGTKFCKANFIFNILCRIVAAILSPVLAAAVLAAWFGNDDGEEGKDQAGGGELKLKDRVIVRGTFTYDAGHEGWNEVHAVRIVQKVFDAPNEPNAFRDYLDRWCKRLGEAAPNDRIDERGDPLTTEEPRRPRDDWRMHPLVDGCEPSDQEPIIR